MPQSLHPPNHTIKSHPCTTNNTTAPLQQQQMQSPPEDRNRNEVLSGEQSSLKIVKCK